MDVSHLPEATLNAANQLGGWLAQNDFSGHPGCQDTQLVVMAGNAVMPTIDAACRLVSESGGILLISGGIGHSTVFLYDAIAQHPQYCTLAVEQQPEAVLLAEIAHQFWHIPRARIVAESQSTNCGENAAYTRQIMEERGITAQRATVVQDPTMQRRTMATFARVWQDAPEAPVWRSYPGYIPVLRNTAYGLDWQQPVDGLWPAARYLSLIMGELPRLRDDAQGYGPRGKGFIAHVEIPEEIEAAWRCLSADPRLQQILASRHLN